MIIKGSVKPFTPALPPFRSGKEEWSCRGCCWFKFRYFIFRWVRLCSILSACFENGAEVWKSRYFMKSTLREHVAWNESSIKFVLDWMFVTSRICPFSVSDWNLRVPWSLWNIIPNRWIVLLLSVSLRCGLSYFIVQFILSSLCIRMRRALLFVFLSSFFIFIFLLYTISLPSRLNVFCCSVRLSVVVY